MPIHKTRLTQDSPIHLDPLGISRLQTLRVQAVRPASRLKIRILPREIRYSKSHNRLFYACYLNDSTQWNHIDSNGSLSALGFVLNGYSASQDGYILGCKDDEEQFAYLEPFDQDPHWFFVRAHPKSGSVLYALYDDKRTKFLVSEVFIRFF